MNLQQAEQLAANLLEQHRSTKVNGFIILLDGWSFTWNNRKRAFGLCGYKTKTIQLSQYLTAQRTEEAVKNTILHEIAHAIAGAENGHNRRWKNVARQIGHPNPTASHAENIQKYKTDYKWLLMHETEILGGWFRKPKHPGHLYYPNDRPELKGKCQIVPANSV